MAKTYLDIVKYMVEAKFNIDGLVDKPDIIGAVFGQTEGLLGDELDLRELQKNGKIGRIEIDVSQSGNKTYGRLHLPASLDRVETCILGAAVEAVDRVGPYEAQFNVEKIEDTRSGKRKKILDRAKELMKTMILAEIPDSKELSELVQSEVKAAEIVAYGPEKLPAGPDVGKTPDVIIVEGRADVLTLLRCSITNAVAVGGATSTIPKSLISLCNEKEVTIFADGDRGGDLIIRSILNVAECDFVTKAPEGKEVEELTRKEIIKALRTRVPVDQYLGVQKRQQQHQGRGPGGPMMPLPPTPRPPAPAMAPPQPAAGPMQSYSNEMQRQERRGEAELPRIEQPQPISLRPEKAPSKPVLESVILSQLGMGLEELAGTIRSRMYDQAGNVIKEVPIREIMNALRDTNDVYAVVLDGVITQRLVELGIEKGVRAIYGVRASQLPKGHPEIILYTKEQGRLE